jgi:hypothetical protein
MSQTKIDQKTSTLVVLTGADEQAVDTLAVEIGRKMASDMNRLTGKFAAQQWQAFITDGRNMNKEELLESSLDVMNRHNIMLIVGYQDNDEWNDALSEISKNCSTSLLIVGKGENLKNMAVFETIGMIDDNAPLDIQIENAFLSIKEARGQTARAPIGELTEDGTLSGPKLLGLH